MQPGEGSRIEYHREKWVGLYVREASFYFKILFLFSVRSETKLSAETAGCQVFL